MLPGMDPNLAWEVTMTRAGFDGMEGTEDDMPFMRITDLMNVPGMTPDLMSLMRRFVTNRSNTFEIYVEARIDEYVKMFRAVLVRVMLAFCDPEHALGIGEGHAIFLCPRTDDLCHCL